MSVRMKSQSGFSLIELMIVVAIIGILATVAAPNFKRFMMQSKQGEAKQNLAAFYQAQRAFFDQWQVYPGQFSAAGFRPSGVLNYRITAVNNAAGITALTNYGGANIAACINTSIASSTCFPLDPNNVNNWRESNTASAVSVCVAATAGTPATASTFTACASARHNGVAVNDEFSINQEKNVLQAQNGIP